MTGIRELGIRICTSIIHDLPAPKCQNVGPEIQKIKANTMNASEQGSALTFEGKFTSAKGYRKIKENQLIP